MKNVPLPRVSLLGSTPTCPELPVPSYPRVTPFDVHLDLRPADVGNAEPDPPSPFTPGDGGAIAAAVKKLGLQMRNSKGLSEFIVIDHAERPTPN